MTLIEFVGCIAIIIGALAGGSFAYSRFGAWEAIVGVPAGVIVSLVAAFGVGAALLFVALTKEKIDQRRRLRPVFGRYWSRDRTKDWESLVNGLESGLVLEGKVVWQFPYGVFVDTGHGFPALLKIGDCTDRIHTAQAAISASISARVRGFDNERFIELTQKEDPAKGSVQRPDATDDASDRR
ncbi:MAG: hypothetical protein E2P02_30790 [Acidobacteria bacterium]|nr:MAG: hypothetical protein E2P02_30790 [Acidobacteriota bacterium]